MSRRLESITDHVDRFGFAMCDATSDEIVTDQKGVFRTNCLDWCASSFMALSTRINRFAAWIALISFRTYFLVQL